MRKAARHLQNVAPIGKLNKKVTQNFDKELRKSHWFNNHQAELSSKGPDMGEVVA
jgi:hypothetical protein